MTVGMLGRKRTIANKSHQCVWCGYPVQAGSRYDRQQIVIDGNFQSNAWHEACITGFAAYYDETREEEFYPHAQDMPFFELYQLEMKIPAPVGRKDK